MATALEDVSGRVSAIADSYAAAKRDDLAAELYNAERGLASAQRILNRVVAAER